jgi:hypothetical protein
LLSVLASSTVAVSARAGAPVNGDFNDDGFADLAIGVPLEDINGQPNAGVVHVLYGSASGPASGGSQLWHQDRQGIDDSCEDKDKFGAALVVGDFDGDGIDDLAVGIPGERTTGTVRTGAVQLLWGSGGGLSANDAAYIPIGSIVIDPSDDPLGGGSALAAGDFDDDGLDDLAVGIPGQPVGRSLAAGRIQVFHGDISRALVLQTQIFDQGTKGVIDAPANDEEFGSALAAGDFDGDGFVDLAIGVPGEKVSGATAAGAVNVLYGRATGLHASGDQFWTQSSIGLGDGSERNDFFGSALVSGDFDGDGFADLAIGAALENHGSQAGGPQIVDAGTVIVLYGSAAKLTAAGSQEWNQDTGGISNGPDEGDQFGAALAAGDFDNDGRDDLAIGAPLEGIGGVAAGAVHVLHGSGSGLSASGDQFWHQDQPNMAGGANDGDAFGAALGALDFDGDGFLDLAVGIPGEKVDGEEGAGAVAVIFGSGTGLTAAANQLWTQESAGIADGASEGDGFGGALAD